MWASTPLPSVPSEVVTRRAPAPLRGPVTGGGQGDWRKVAQVPEDRRGWDCPHPESVPLGLAHSTGAS